MKVAVVCYRMDHGGKCPGRLQDLISRPTGATGWRGPYLQDFTSVPPDPWGNTYFYRVPGAGGAAYEIFSLGKDGRPGGTEEDEDLSSCPRRL